MTANLESSIKRTRFVPDARRGRKIAIGKGPQEGVKETDGQTDMHFFSSYKLAVARGQLWDNLIEKIHRLIISFVGLVSSNRCGGCPAKDVLGKGNEGRGERRKSSSKEKIRIRDDHLLEEESEKNAFVFLPCSFPPARRLSPARRPHAASHLLSSLGRSGGVMSHRVGFA